MISLLSRLATLIALLATVVSQPSAAQAVMKLANATINDVQHEWQKVFAAELAKRVGSKVKTEIYPASQLGAIPRMVDGVLPFAVVQIAALLIITYWPGLSLALTWWTF